MKTSYCPDRFHFSFGTVIWNLFWLHAPGLRFPNYVHNAKKCPADTGLNVLSVNSETELPAVFVKQNFGQVAMNGCYHFPYSLIRGCSGFSYRCIP
jgi:hypothetical protein